MRMGLFFGVVMLLSEITHGQPQQLTAKRTELGILPVVAYSSDLGLGFGVLGTRAKFHPDYYPYRWRFQFLAYATIQKKADGGIRLPFHNYSFRWDKPGFLSKRLRLNLKLGFKRYLTSGYYGVGNASVFERRWERYDSVKTADDFQLALKYNQYDRTYPFIDAKLRYRVQDHDHGGVDLFASSSSSYNVISIYPKSKLEEDLQKTASDPVRSYLIGTPNHMLTTLTAGSLWDSRDHETTPQRGSFHDISFRLGLGSAESIRYWGGNVTLRLYHPLIEDYLILAARSMFDFVSGRPPFYELALAGGFYPDSAPGGGAGVRGLVDLRLYGKVKQVNNIELRGRLQPISLFSQRFMLGGVLFWDSGRVWSEMGGSPLDLTSSGSNAGYYQSLGAGGRLRWGETFLIRGDLAYAFKDQTIGIYIDLNHLF